MVFKTAIIQLVLVLSLNGFGTSSWAQSIELDKELGAENARMVASQMGIYADEEMNAYVRRVGERLVAQLDNPQFDFQFHIVDDPVPNAFALPGGYVYVTRGILSLMVTEDELACVMGHEIIHVTKRHSIKQMKKSIFPRLLELPGKLVGSVVNEDLGRILNAPIETSNNLLMASHSRKHETQSDTLGVALASKAGYDPTAMNRILTRLSGAVEYLTQQEDKKSYFDDHPYTPDRVTNINAVAAGLTWQATSKLADDFPMPLNSLMFAQNPGAGVFSDSRFLHPDLNFTLEFPEGWSTSNKPEAVGAVDENRQGFVYLGLTDNAMSPAQHAEVFAQKAYMEYKITPQESKKITVNGNPGYMVSFMDDSGGKPMLIHQLWVSFGDKTFQLVGATPEKNLDKLKTTALSLRPLTSKERKSIHKLVMYVEKARANESVEALIKRTNSEFDAKIIAFLNAVEPEKPLPAGKLMKVFRKEVY